MRKIFVLAICIILIFNSISFQPLFADEIDDGEYYIDAFKGNDVEAINNKAIHINAGAAIVMDMKSGRVLYEKNARVRRAIASTTKIMTALLAIENGNLNDTVTVSKRAARVSGSTIDLKQGQKLKLQELLYGLMLKSGNDAAITIAEHIGGSVEGFVEMMNRKAGEIGAKDTSFRSPHGLDMTDHYSTAYDLARITKYALENPTFSKIVGTESAYVGMKMVHNTNELLGAYPGADGVKTGYTGQAGRCLVTSVTRNAWRIISVVLGSPTRSARARSSQTILDFAYDNYKPYTLIKAEQNMASLEVIKGKEPIVSVQAVEQIRLPLSQDEVDSLRTEVDLPEALTAPVDAGIEIGSIKYVVNDKVVAQTALKTSREVPRKNVFSYLGEIFGMWVDTARNGMFP